MQICDSIAIIGELEPVLSLEMEYRPDDVYAKKVRDLSSKYKSIRRTRPDGNCFFRAFAYAYFERLLEDKQEYQRFYDIASKSKETLVNLGFPKFTVEDFHDTVRILWYPIKPAAYLTEPVICNSFIFLPVHGSYR